MNKVEPPHLSMRGPFLLRHEFPLGTGAGSMISAAALATGQRLAVLLRGAGDDSGDFSIDSIALVAQLTKLLSVQWLPPFQGRQDGERFVACPVPRIVKDGENGFGGDVVRAEYFQSPKAQRA
jgi:hypothetical protein